MEFQLTPGLLLGAALQTGGGGQNSSWYGWYRRGYIKDNADPSAAADGRKYWREDLDRMAAMGIRCCRWGIEWSQVEPREGVFDEAAIARCREVLAAMAERGIRPLLTLHAFANPLWLEEKGAFAARDSVTYFLRYVRRAVEGVGDLAEEFLTFDQPNLYAFRGYLDASWPPGRHSLMDLARACTNLAAAHIEAYGLIRKTRLQMGYPDTRVSFAGHWRFFVPQDPRNPVHRFWASRAEQLFQGSLARAMCMGRTGFPVGRHPAIVPGRYCDFHAVSYYARSTISGPAAPAAQGPRSGLGWEIDPAGIAAACRTLHGLLPRPIYIAANGVCDSGDAFRARYIAEHLQALCRSGLPVERYYYHSLCDGWEGLEGTSARFGLVHVNFASQARTVKASGEFFRQVIAQGGVSQALYRQYCGAPYPGEEPA